MPEPLRVLHVLHRLTTGGITNWLVDVLRHTDPGRVCFDFAVHREGDTPYRGEIEARGARVFRLPDRRRVGSYVARLYQLLQGNGPYHAVHSHYHLFSGVVLSVARLARVPVRIAHVHKDDGPDAGSPRKPIVAKALRALLHFSCTHCLACSRRGAISVWGPAWQRESRVEVFPYGFNFSPFLAPNDRVLVRSAVAVPADALIVGHVGNFVPAKNHEFLVRVFRETLELHAEAYLLLIGDGDRRPAIEKLCHDLGIAERVRFLGFRRDLASLLKAMDTLVFPSLIEGLPITVLQAQLAGLPVIASTAVPEEANITGRVLFLSLDIPAKVWAKHVIEAARMPKPDVVETAHLMQRYHIENVVARLTEYYCEGIAQAKP